MENLQDDLSTTELSSNSLIKGVECVNYISRSSLGTDNASDDDTLELLWEEDEAADLQTQDIIYEDLNPLLEGSLQPIVLYGGDIAKHNTAFLDGTREWLFAEVEQWRQSAAHYRHASSANNGASRLFWLQADAGMGKSTFAGRLAHTYRETGHLLGAVFFSYNTTLRADIRVLIRSLAVQIGTHIPELVDSIIDGVARLRLLEETMPSTKADTEQSQVEAYFKELILKPLQTWSDDCVSAVELENTRIIIIDALDEAEGGKAAGNTVDRADLLRFLFTQLVAQLPPQVKVLITSRPEDDILYYADAFHAHVIAESDPRHQTDLRLLVMHHLHDLAARDSELCARAVDIVMRKSEGKFVYLSTVVKDLSELNKKRSLSTAEEVEAFLESQLPAGLDASYARFLQQIFVRFQAYAQWLRSILRVLVCAREALTVAQLQLLVAYPNEMKAATRPPFKHLVRSLQSIFPLERVRVQDGSVLAVMVPYHKTIVDWLIDASRSGGGLLALKDRTLDITSHNLNGSLGDSMERTEDESEDQVSRDTEQQYLKSYFYSDPALGHAQIARSLLISQLNVKDSLLRNDEIGTELWGLEGSSVVDDTEHGGIGPSQWRENVFRNKDDRMVQYTFHHLLAHLDAAHSPALSSSSPSSSRTAALLTNLYWVQASLQVLGPREVSRWYRARVQGQGKDNGEDWATRHGVNDAVFAALHVMNTLLLRILTYEPHDKAEGWPRVLSHLIVSNLSIAGGNPLTENGVVVDSLLNGAHQWIKRYGGYIFRNPVQNAMPALPKRTGGAQISNRSSEFSCHLTGSGRMQAARMSEKRFVLHNANKWQIWNHETEDVECEFAKSNFSAITEYDDEHWLVTLAGTDITEWSSARLLHKSTGQFKNIHLIDASKPDRVPGGVNAIEVVQRRSDGRRVVVFNTSRGVWVWHKEKDGTQTAREIHEHRQPTQENVTIPSGFQYSSYNKTIHWHVGLTVLEGGRYVCFSISFSQYLLWDVEVEQLYVLDGKKLGIDYDQTRYENNVKEDHPELDLILSFGPGLVVVLGEGRQVVVWDVVRGRRADCPALNDLVLTRYFCMVVNHAQHGAYFVMVVENTGPKAQKKRGKAAGKARKDTKKVLLVNESKTTIRIYSASERQWRDVPFDDSVVRLLTITDSHVVIAGARMTVSLDVVSGRMHPLLHFKSASLMPLQNVGAGRVAFPPWNSSAENQNEPVIIVDVLHPPMDPSVSAALTVRKDPEYTVTGRFVNPVGKEHVWWCNGYSGVERRQVGAMHLPSGRRTMYQEVTGQEIFAVGQLREDEILTVHQEGESTAYRIQPLGNRGSNVSKSNGVTHAQPHHLLQVWNLTTGQRTHSTVIPFAPWQVDKLGYECIHPLRGDPNKILLHRYSWWDVWLDGKPSPSYAVMWDRTHSFHTRFPLPNNCVGIVELADGRWLAGVIPKGNHKSASPHMRVLVYANCTFQTVLREIILPGRFVQSIYYQSFYCLDDDDRDGNSMSPAAHNYCSVIVEQELVVFDVNTGNVTCRSSVGEGSHSRYIRKFHIFGDLLIIPTHSVDVWEYQTGDKLCSFLESTGWSHNGFQLFHLDREKAQLIVQCQRVVNDAMQNPLQQYRVWDLNSFSLVTIIDDLFTPCAQRLLPTNVVLDFTEHTRLPFLIDSNVSRMVISHDRQTLFLHGSQVRAVCVQVVGPSAEEREKEEPHLK